MLTRDQAAILRDLALKVVIISRTGEVMATPVHDVPKVADALASLDTVIAGHGVHSRVAEFFRSLLGANTWGEEMEQRAKELLHEIRGDTVDRADMNLTTIGRGLVEIEVDGWVPRETFAALLRIAEAVLDLSQSGRVMTVSDGFLAHEVERIAGEAKRSRSILAEVRKLIEVTDADFDGDVTPTSVELTTRFVQELLDRGHVKAVAAHQIKAGDPIYLQNSAAEIEALRQRCESAERGERAANQEVDRLRQELDQVREKTGSHDAETGKANYWRSAVTSKFACWWGEGEPREITEVEAVSAEDAALSFFLRKMSDRPAHDNVRDFDQVGVVNLETSSAYTINVKVMVETSTEIPF